MRYIVTDPDNDYIFVSDFQKLRDHLNRLINQVCRTEPPTTPTTTPTYIPTSPVATSSPHIGASMLQRCWQSADFSEYFLSLSAIVIPNWRLRRRLMRFYPRDAMLARVIEIATCLSVRLSVCLSLCPSRAGIVSKRRKLASWFLHHLVAPRL